MIPETKRAIRETLLDLGLRPRKEHGQHFLADSNLRDAIVAAAGVRSGDLVLEVGPGLGILTRGLLDTGCRVLAVEIDRGLADFLEAELGGEARFALVRGSVLERGEIAPRLLEALERARSGTGRFLSVSNLPYGVSTPFLLALARHPHPPERTVVMVQKEVARRMAGRPGSSDYGPLAVLLALSGQVRMLREVGGQVFFPSVPVRSAVVEFCPGPVRTGDLVAGDRAARVAFLHRRKTLRRALLAARYDPGAVDAAIESAAADPVARPETLTPQQFVALGHALFPESGGQARS